MPRSAPRSRPASPSSSSMVASSQVSSGSGPSATAISRARSTRTRPRRSVIATREWVAPMSAPATTPASPLKASVVGGSATGRRAVGPRHQPAVGQQHVDPLGDGRAGQAGGGGQVAPGDGVAVPDQVEDRAGRAARRRRRIVCSTPTATTASEPADPSAFQTPKVGGFCVLTGGYFCLTIDRSGALMVGVGGTTPGRTGSDAHRVGIIGAGFIGEVHARALRRAGARLVGVAASSPATTDEAVARLGAERGFAAEDAGHLPRRRRRAHLHARTTCTPRWPRPPWRRASTWCARSRWPPTPRPPPSCWPRPTGPAPSPPCPSSTASTRWSARRGPGSPTGRWPCASSTASYLQDWLSSDAGRQLARRRRAVRPSRAFADIGSHWCDLVEFVTGDRLASVCAELVTAVPERASAGDHGPAFAARRRATRTVDRGER